VKPTAVVGRHGARKTRVASSRRLHVCQRALWRGVGLVVVCGGEHLRIAQKPRAARAAGKRKQRGVLAPISTGTFAYEPRSE
jgi:hypothetical protein